MPLVNIGRDALASALIGDGGIAVFNNANARLGVGDSTTPYAATQTDLQAATNLFRRVMEATYPTRTANSIDFRALFATTEANFAWQEWGVFNAQSGGQMLSRIVTSLGTKPNTQSWEFTATVAINVGT